MRPGGVGELRDDVRLLPRAPVHPRHREVERLAIGIDGDQRGAVGADDDGPDSSLVPEAKLGRDHGHAGEPRVGVALPPFGVPALDHAHGNLRPRQDFPPQAHQGALQERRAYVVGKNHSNPIYHGISTKAMP